MKKTRLALVGGFLGAGKTTLLAQAGRRLARQGKTVGFITNDQAAQLVDTELLQRSGLDVKEVAGACFCCKFDELIQRGDELLAEKKPDILISEPVGSCTDLTATVIQPVKKFFAERFTAAPYSVLVDPFRLRQALSPETSVFSSSVLYIFNKQLEEADLIVLNKADQLNAAELAELTGALRKHFPQATVMALSALNGDGLDEWLTAIQQDTPSGMNVAKVDYDTYAEGEAQLGWLNASVLLSATQDTDWRDFAHQLLRDLKREFDAAKAEVAHVKLSLTASGTGLTANLTSSKGMPFVLVQGIKGHAGREARLILNARVQITPPALKACVEKVLAEYSSKGVSAAIQESACFAPGRPTPTHRFKGNE